MEEQKKKKSKKGGARPGAGRPRKIRHISNYQKAIQCVDESLLPSLELINGVIEKTKEIQRKNGEFSKDEMDFIKMGIHSAELILKKALPDRLDLKNQYKKEALKAQEDYKKLSDEDLENIINGG